MLEVVASPTKEVLAQSLCPGGDRGPRALRPSEFYPTGCLLSLPDGAHISCFRWLLGRMWGLQCLHSADTEGPAQELVLVCRQMHFLPSAFLPSALIWAYSVGCRQSQLFKSRTGSTPWEGL